MNRYLYNGLKIKFHENTDGTYSPTFVDENNATIMERMLNLLEDREIKAPLPARMRLQIIDPPDDDKKVPKFMDKEGELWGTSLNGRKIYKSTDFWETQEEVLSVPNNYGSLSNCAMLVSDTGRIVACTNQGHVFVSNEEQTSFPAAPTFSFLAGKTFVYYPWDKYNEIILLASYGPHDGQNPPRELYASFDDGETFTKIFEKSIEGMQVPSFYHIHAVEYDPYADRIWLAIGDGQNIQIHYSDDRGETWKDVFEYPVESVAKVTAICSFPHGTVFGTDSQPNGLRFLPRNRRNVKEKPNAENFVIDYFVVDSEDVTNDLLVFYKPFRLREQGSNLTIMPSAYDITTPPVILLTENGIDWYEIYRLNPSDGVGFWNFIGPAIDDNERNIIGTGLFEGTVKIFKGKLPNII